MDYNTANSIDKLLFIWFLLCCIWHYMAVVAAQNFMGKWCALMQIDEMREKRQPTNNVS